MQLNYNRTMLFPNFPENSKVWVYAANRFFTEHESKIIQHNVDLFTKQWAAHGSGLVATGSILHNSFIVLVADENQVKASGCSVDSSVRFIKDIGKEFEIDFFNRLHLLIEKKGEFKRIHFSELQTYSDWNLFNPLVQNLKELRENWCVQIAESQFVK